MDYNYIIDALENNHSIFFNLLKAQKKEAYLWRPSADHWCLLEIICHLYDEEKEDFRTRLRTTLETPGILPPAINPAGWITERKYIERNYEIMLHKFLDERTESVHWLRSLEKPQWENSYIHPSLGTVTAHHFINNWLAHDYLHIRQITRLKYNYLKFLSGETLDYAGNW